MTEKPEENVANTVVVIIHPDGTVDQTPIELSKTNGDHILWKSDADFACDIVFTGGRSPFKEHVFHVEKKISKDSEEIRKDVQPNDRFHFDVLSKGQIGQTVAADPDVIIRN